MFKKIAQKHFNYRESWEILIEVLGQHMGIVQQPFLYSDPELDVETFEDLSPIHRAPMQIETPKYDLLSYLLGIAPKNTQNRIMPPDPYHPHYECYLDKNIKTRIKLRPFTRYSHSTEVIGFVKQFNKEGLLDSYVEKARLEAFDGGSENIYAGVDHLGALFEEYMLAGKKNRLGQMLTPMNVVRMMITMTFMQNEKTPAKKMSKEPITDLDTAAGSGRFLIMASLMLPRKPLILYGIEIDITLYRCCLVNMALYSQHPYYIVCADSLRLNIDNPASTLWHTAANQWDPPDMIPYYYHFERVNSFEAIVRRRKENLQFNSTLATEEPITILSPQAKSPFLSYLKAKNKQ